MKQALGMASVQTECFPWRSAQTEPGPQVDLVVERKDKMTHLCEMKYSDAPLSIDAGYEAKLKRKVEAFREETRTRNAIARTMVCANGLARNAHSWDVADVVTADDLFAF